MFTNYTCVWFAVNYFPSYPSSFNKVRRFLFNSNDCLSSLNERARNQGVRTLIEEITSSCKNPATTAISASAIDSNTLTSDPPTADTVTVTVAAEEIVAKAEYAHSPIQVSYFCLLFLF